MMKIQINNQIVLMRKDAKQARIHIIKKLSREIKLLRNKKGTDKEKEKNKRKADRFAAEILSSKKLKADEMTRFSINNTLSLKEILENLNSTPRDRFLGRIAFHKKFSQKIKAFKEKFPNYADYMDSKKNKVKTKVKQKESKEESNVGSDIKKGITAFRETSSERESGSEDGEDSENDSCIENFKNEDDSSKHGSENEVKSDEDVTSNIKQDNQKVNDSSENESDNDLNNYIYDSKNSHSEGDFSDAEEKLNNENNSDNEEIFKSETKPHKIKQKTREKVKKKNEIPKPVSKEAVVKRFEDLIKENVKDTSNEQAQVLKEDDKSVVKLSEKLRKQKHVDSFFLTADGKDYQSIAPIRIVESRSTNRVENDNDTNYRFNKRKFEGNKNDKFFNKLPKFDKGVKKLDSRREKMSSIQPNRAARRFNEGKSSNKVSLADETSSTILHPSWEAKKKQQDMLKQGFQGKKIVFGDDDT